MAKKKATAATAAASEWLTCADYTLTLDNSESSFICELNVHDTNGDPFHLRVRRTNDRPGLVQRALGVIGVRWPAFAWEFQANDDGEITDIR